MSDKVRILAFAGSTRQASFNKQLLSIAVEGAREAGAEVTLIDLREYRLPLYDGDLETEQGLPENAVKLRDLFLENDGLLMSCPEYNSSISGVWKNTIDWVSRPQPGRPGLECFLDKFAVVMTASTGQWGGVRAIQEYRRILSNIRVKVLPEQISIRRAKDEFAADGSMNDEKRQQAVRALGTALYHAIAVFRRGEH
jgi:NAD(P)H-dependent FMN reductase